MANDLVPRRRRPDAQQGTVTEEGGPWDPPPVAERPPDAGPIHDREAEAGIRAAEKDVANARQRGDTTFAHLREGDADDLRQRRWGSGDARTWLWLGGMCLVFLALVAFVYYMPTMRNASPVPIRVY